MKRITGGKQGYRAAVQDALYGDGSRMHSPAVHWTETRGFFVSPAAKLVPMNDGEVEVWEAAFSANTGRPYCLPDYNEVRDLISAGLN